MKIDLLITGAAQLVTCRGAEGPLREAALRTPEIIQDGAIAVDGGQIVAVGTTAELTGRFQPRQTLDATGHAIVPGFVDPHTHILYAGNRVGEFEQRIAGATYQEIMAAGGGIVSTMKATRAASVEQLVAETRPRLAAMLRLGSTTVEVKSGYGLSTESELRMLAGIAALDQAQPVDLVPTFMGAHALPPEYRGQGEAYTQLVIDEMLPAVVAWYEASHFAAQGMPCFNDVFCEQ
ncbi:MAG: imidazolonepropionase, partial [Anaerolineales bacterium]|nr:imidazolonepropionase [Anaerolineales bacterium]